MMTGVKLLSICMKPTFNSKYTEFPKASVPVGGIIDYTKRFCVLKDGRVRVTMRVSEG